MFSTRNTKNDATNVVQEKAIEPRTERPLVFRIEQLEQRIAPLCKLQDAMSPK
jgi:hypothetical protein